MARSKRPQGTRNPNGEGSLYFSEYDGYWHARVTVGVLDDGRPDRRHIKRRREDDAREEYRKLLNERDQGNVRRKGRDWTVEAWLRHWVDNIAPLTVRYKTLRGYQTAVNKHLIPGVGAHRMKRIEPEHFEKLYAKMLESGLKPGTAHQVHRTARTAFGEAERRGIIQRNPAALAKAPRVEEEEVEPLEADEIQRLLSAALSRRNGVRYVLALALGARQGEALGMRWSYLDERRKTLRVKKALQRQKWQHGCDNPHACGGPYHRTEKCKQPCKKHTRPCPEPCSPTCTEHARKCPQRKGGGLVEVDVKSRAGRRTFPLPDELFNLLMRHRERQARERDRAGSEWHEGDWIFTQPNGKPLDPRADYGDWKALLAEAGVREARLHDARHTAATVLLILGVPDRTVMDLMGWSTVSMKARYMHVTDEIRRDVADQLNGYFWNPN
ncbi:tyrosine-type recombinase/integrase [Amycolatopsis thermophila]|uniref:Integrase n=1 Tax=Amycolatopsis thermophila TaxID=206084 RepID=A0ABU0EU06_9PSEU|nr:site-specific integrase [Amycolatopsis thermophila]MDQ0378578.1 integrase [Amycolatopsis thermophila]